MSLVVWLPLTKDLRNQGLSNVTVTNNGATFNSVGKLGGCYNFTNQNIVVPSNNFKSEFTNNQASLAAWVKVTTSHSAYAQALVLGTQGTSWNNILLGIDINGSGTPIANASTGSAYTNLSFGIAIKDGVWHHIAYTYNAGTMKVYLDGVQKATTTTSNTPAWTNSTNLYIGGNTAGEKFQNGDSMNDVRIYNHCLSPMEVKELAKGLVLHYPLNREGWGQENQLKNSNFFNGTNSWYSVNSSSIWVETKDGYTCGTGTKGTSANIIGQTSAAYTGGTTVDITVSAKVYVTETGTFGVGHWISTTQVSGWQSMSGSRVWNTTNNLSVGWNYISTTLKNATNQYTGSIVTAFSYSGTTFWITDVKLEFGQIATPWCPNSSDTLATTMGLNSTTEYDCSGFGNNGTKVGTLGWSSNTPKYNVSLDITTDSCARYIYGPAQTQLTDQITLACWLYQTSATATSGGNSTTNQFALSQGRDYLNLGFNITVNNGKPGVYAGNGGSESGARVSLISTTKTITGSWHHVAATYNNGALKLYVDGQLDRETTIGALDYVDAPALVIGKMAYGYTGTTAYFPFRGYISDARVYATALSADDVKSLYQNSAYIDSSGNVYGTIHEV